MRRVGVSERQIILGGTVGWRSLNAFHKAEGVGGFLNNNNNTIIVIMWPLRYLMASPRPLFVQGSYGFNLFTPSEYMPTYVCIYICMYLIICAPSYTYVEGGVSSRRPSQPAPTSFRFPRWISPRSRRGHY